MKSTTIIGLDFSTNTKKRKAFQANIDGGKVESIKKLDLSRDNEFISNYINGLNNDSTKVILAIDSPMGWPDEMIRELSKHNAGAKIENLKNQARQNYFRRVTDKIMIERVKKIPLSIGADKIASMAFDALSMISLLNGNFKLDVGVGNTKINDNIIIEVYPGGYLANKTIDIVLRGYKNDKHKRSQIYDQIIKKNVILQEIKLWKHEIIEDDDTFDAFICLLAGIDYNDGRLKGPNDYDKKDLEIHYDDSTILKEGWIWTEAK